MIINRPGASISIENVIYTVGMFAPHLTAMLVREIKQNGGECEI